MLAPRGSGFIDRYVFPGGELAHVSRMVRDTAAAGLDIVDIENLRPHYTQTLLHWVRRLQTHQNEAEALIGPEKCRVWRIYMAGAALAFDRGWLSLYQTLAVKPDAAGYASRPWTRRHQYVLEETRPLAPPSIGAISNALRRDALTLQVGAANIAPPGRMAEWLCRGLQILVQRFDSASGLHTGSH